MLDLFKSGSAKIEGRRAAMEKDVAHLEAKVATVRREREEGHDADLAELASGTLTIVEFTRKQDAAQARVQGAEDALVATKSAIELVTQELEKARRREEVDAHQAQLEKIRVEAPRALDDLRKALLPALEATSRCEDVADRYRRATRALSDLGLPTQHQVGSDDPRYREAAERLGILGSVDNVYSGLTAIKMITEEVLASRETWSLGPVYLSLPKGSAEG